MMVLATNGFRCIAHDRRGHGRSSQPWGTYDRHQFASDLDDVVTKLGITHAIDVGHSMGGGEVTRYVARHARGRVAKMVLIAAVTPVMLQSSSNPGGLPMKVFDGIRAGVAGDRAQFYKDLSGPFYGANRPNSKVSQGLRDNFQRIGMQGSIKAQYDCVKAFSETDFTEDLKSITVPSLVIHGDDDQIVPIDDSAKIAAKLLKNGQLKVIAGAPHGICSTNKDDINQALLAFARG